MFGFKRKPPREGNRYVCKRRYKVKYYTGGGEQEIEKGSNWILKYIGDHGAVYLEREHTEGVGIVVGTERLKRNFKLIWEKPE